MGLRVSGKNFDIGEALREHVLGRLQSSAEKYFKGLITGHVVVDHEGSGYRTDCTLHLGTGVTLQAEGYAQEPYISVDQAADRLEKRLRRYKSRLKSHHNGERNGGAATPTPQTDEEIAAHYTLHAPEDDEQTFHPVVVAEKTKAMATLTVSAAVTDLDFTGVPVLVFRNASSGRVNFVYRRSDGHIGWIDPTPSERDGDRS